MAFNPELIFISEEIADEEERYELRINRRHLRDISNPFTLPEGNFRGIYCLSRQLAFDLLDEISPHMRNIQRHQIAIPAIHKIFATFHFLAQGSYQKCVGQDYFLPMAQQTLSVCINEVTSAIVTHMSYIIKFPQTDQERTMLKEGFMDRGGFPGIIDAIDCTHIAIQAPPFHNPQMPGIVFLNRKGFYSINVQIIVDANLKILNVNSRFPGSVHDSAIWTSSLVKTHLEENFNGGNNNCWLIGDSGYPLQLFLITPVEGNNLNTQEINFNRAHKSSRNIIERLNGVLKARFRCCLRHRTLHYKPEVAAKIINTCAILHNFSLNHDEIFDLDNDPYPEEPAIPHDYPESLGRNWLNEGRLTRQRIINMYFQNINAP